MSEIDHDPVQLLTSHLLPAMHRRVAALGVAESGAFEFYRSALEHARLFKKYEVDLARAIKCRFPNLHEIHEIGCGWGQFVFLLAWHGYATTGYEIDDRRHEAAVEWHRLLQVVDPEKAARAQIRHEFFPPLRMQKSAGTMAISTNIVVKNPRFVEEQILFGLRRYEYSLVNLDRFCYIRRQSERSALISRVEAMGLVNEGLFLDAGPNGYFFLFRLPR